MKFEETGNTKNPHKLTFEGEEPAIVSAVWREFIYNQVCKGKADLISDFDAWVAGWQDEKNQSVWVGSYESVVEKLETFHGNTVEAIKEIPETTSEPPFASRDILKRYQLGKAALELANTIRQQVARAVFIEDISDSEISRLLEGGQLDGRGDQ